MKTFKRIEGKKLVWFFLFAAFFLVLGLSCDLEPDPETGDGTFWALDLSASGTVYYKIQAKLREEGEHCLVYEEIPGIGSNSQSIPYTQVLSLINEFDTKIYPKLTPVFGEPVDVSGSGKVTLLLMDIRDGFVNAETTPGYVAGYFSYVDIENGPYSNHRDMLYIDTWPATLSTPQGRAQIYGTIAHEFQHLINYSRHVGGNEMELWIDEGLAESAGYVYSGVLDQSRIKYYREDPKGSIQYGNTFYVWYDGFDDVLAEYATVYLFFQWLRIQADNGIDIYSEIISSDKTDYRAVLQAADDHLWIPDWENLLRYWFAANFFCDPDGLAGYGGKINENELNARAYNAGAFAEHKVDLLPGEGVYSVLPSALTPPTGSGYGANICYAELDYASLDVNDTPPFNTGGSGEVYLLTFNGNTKNAGLVQSDIETGYITNVLPSPGSQRMLNIQAAQSSRALVPEKIPEPWEWDGARYFFDKCNPAPRGPARRR